MQPVREFSHKLRIIVLREYKLGKAVHPPQGNERPISNFKLAMDFTPRPCAWGGAKLGSQAILRRTHRYTYVPRIQDNCYE